MALEHIINPSLDIDPENVKPKKIEITDTDKENYLKSILTDSPYEESAELFDGQLKVRFRGMSVQENNDVVAQIIKDRENGVAGENDAYFITISTYRLALALVSIGDKEYSSVTKENFKPADPDDTYVLARMAPIRAWSTAKLSIFLDAFRAFEAKQLKLTSEVQTSNFWKASA